MVDDGSEMPVAEALADLVAAADGRLRVLRHDRSRGVSRARNRGLEAATSDWVGFCDDDDIWAPHKVRSQLASAPSPDVVWTCSGALGVDPDLKPLFAMRAPIDHTDAEGILLETNLIPGGASSVVARTQVVRDLGGFDPDLSTLADWDMWIRLGAAGLLLSVDRPLVAYLIHPLGMSNDAPLLLEDMVRMRAKHDEAYTRFATEVDDRRWMSYVGYQALRSGDREGAARAFARAARAGRVPGPLGAAGLALAWPAGALRRQARRRHADIPATWTVEATAWLADIGEPGLDEEGPLRGPRPSTAWPGLPA